MSSLKAVKKAPSLADSAYKIIHDAIIAGTLKPDETLTEEKLAESMQISRTPIRAALQRLVLEEIITYNGKNLVVSNVTEKDVHDVNVLRLKLEPLALSLIAPEKLTPTVIKRLSVLLEKQQEAVTQNNHSAYLDADYAFHTLLSQFSDNKYLYDVIVSSNLVAKRFLSLSGTLGKYQAAALVEHMEILSALEEKDVDKAAQAMRKHIENVDFRFFK